MTRQHFFCGCESTRFGKKSHVNLVDVCVLTQIIQTLSLMKCVDFSFFISLNACVQCYRSMHFQQDDVYVFVLGDIVFSVLS